MAQPTYADLEIRIRKQTPTGYPVELTLNSEQEFAGGGLAPGFLPWVSTADPVADGQRLFAWLFADDKLKSAWAEVRGQHSQRRVRLRIDADAPELHTIPWELLREPLDDVTARDLAAANATPFSRYLAGSWQPGGPILKRPLRILVAVANPNLEQYKDPTTGKPLPQIDIATAWNDLQVAVSGLDIELVLLPQPCTLAAIENALNAGIHILHFIGHGAYDDTRQQAVLYLANDDNKSMLVKDIEFTTMLQRKMLDMDAQTADRLRLVFLASCQTAERSNKNAFQGLAPRLVQAGVPAVIAMQGQIGIKTARDFATTFYSQLLCHGQVDLATNEARAHLLTAKLPGASLPVLFMRQRDGLLFDPKFVHTPRQIDLAQKLQVYLKQVGQGNPPPDKYTDGQKKLWYAVFHVRARSNLDIAPTELWQTISTGFKEDQAMERIQRVVLLGEAGMGKTPALYKIQTQVAFDSLEALRSYGANGKAKTNLDSTKITVPLFVHLTDLQSGAPLLNLVRDTFNKRIAKQFPRHRINSDEMEQLTDRYCCLFLFDGLDELSSTIYSECIRTLQNFMDTYPNQQFVIACRTTSYRAQLGTIGTLWLTDLNEKQAQEILGEERYATLTHSLKHLARNRKALNTILSLPDVGSSIENKGQLIKHLTLGHLAMAQGQGMQLTEGLLERLAYAMMSNHLLRCSERDVMEITRAYLDEWHETSTWREITSALHTATPPILLRDEERYWSFCDRTTAAYYAAAQIVRDPKLLEPVRQEASGLWWRETLEILVGLLPDPVPLLFELIDRDVLVAAYCVQFCGSTINKKVEDAIIDALIEQMSRESSVIRQRIVMRLGESNHPRAAEALVRALHREWSSMVLLSIARELWKWSKRNNGKQIEAIEAKLMHSVPQQTQKIAHVLALYDPAPGNTCESSSNNQARLIKLLTNPRTSRMTRGLAAIGLGLSNDPKANAALLRLFKKQDLDDFVAWCVADALTLQRDIKIQAKVRDFYEDSTYQGAEWKHHRARAIYILGWISTDKAISTLLQRALVEETNEFARGQAVQAIARLNLPEARSLLEERLKQELEPYVHRKIAEALGQLGSLSSIQFLEQHLQSETTRTRWMVRKAIAEIKDRHEIR